MVIHWDELPDEHSATILDIFDRMDALHEVADDVRREDGYEQQYLRASRILHPHLMAYALVSKHTSQFERDAYRDSLATYVRLNALTHKYRFALQPQFAEQVRLILLSAVVTLLDLPDTPLSRITALLDAAEEATRSTGQPLDLLHYSRAVVAAVSGDIRSVERWLDAAAAVETSYPSPFTPPNQLIMDAVVLQAVSWARALERLESVGSLDDIPDVEAASIRAHRAHLLALLGRRQEAERAATSILLDYDLAEIRSASIAVHLLRALDGQRASGELLIGWVAEDIEMDAPASEYETMAAVARHLLLDPATRDHGFALRERAQAHAREFDARNGNDYVSTEMHRVWFADLQL